MNDLTRELGRAEEDFHDEVSDEALEAAASTIDALAGVASNPFTYISGMCC